MATVKAFETAKAALLKVIEAGKEAKEADFELRDALQEFVAELQQKVAELEVSISLKVE